MLNCAKVVPVSDKLLPLTISTCILPDTSLRHWPAKSPTPWRVSKRTLNSEKNPLLANLITWPILSANCPLCKSTDSTTTAAPAAMEGYTVLSFPPEIRALFRTRYRPDGAPYGCPLLTLCSTFF